MLAKEPAKCGICDKKMNRFFLSFHMRKIHQQIIKFTFETCGTDFKGEKALRNHEKNHDPKIGDGKFGCENCQIFYTQKHTLKNHIKTRHEESNK